MVKGTTEICELDGRTYRRFIWEREDVPASRQYRYQGATATKRWRDLPPRCAKLRARIDAALDNPQTSG